MRQEQIVKTPRKRPGRDEPLALLVTPRPSGADDAEDLLDRIDQILESA